MRCRSVGRAMIAAGFGLLAACSNEARIVCVSGFNENARQIYEFWLDNEHKSGCFGNPPGKEVGSQSWGGGGKFACGCSATPGRRVSLFWEFAQTWDEYQKHVPPEQHTIQVTIPQPESRYSRYLRVYFRKDGTAALQWVDDMGAPTLPLSKDTK